METTVKQHANAFRASIEALPKLKLSDGVTYHLDFLLETSTISDAITGEILYYPEAILDDISKDDTDIETYDEYIAEKYLKTYVLDDYTSYNDWTLQDAKRVARIINTTKGITIHHGKLYK